jgi:hypothetical protein
MFGGWTLIVADWLEYGAFQSQHNTDFEAYLLVQNGEFERYMSNGYGETKHSSCMPRLANATTATNRTLCI